jgi:hypothetical protein
MILEVGSNLDKFNVYIAFSIASRADFAENIIFVLSSRQNTAIIFLNLLSCYCLLYLYNSTYTLYVNTFSINKIIYYSVFYIVCLYIYK